MKGPWLFCALDLPCICVIATGEVPAKVDLRTELGTQMLYPQLLIMAIVLLLATLKYLAHGAWV